MLSSILLNFSMKKIIFYFLVVVFMASSFPSRTDAIFQLVKSTESSAVYFIDQNGVRHAFPNFETYKSWYGEDFSSVLAVSPEFLASHPLGKNITLRSGKQLVKISSDPKVYAVERGGLLRHVDNSDVGELLFGNDWQKHIIDIPEVFFNDYEVGTPLLNTFDIPNDIPYKVDGEETIFWKTAEILQPFTSLQAVLDNGYSEKEIVVGRKSYYKREKPITGNDVRIFNPASARISDQSDCSSENLKVGVTFISDGGFLENNVEKIEILKQEFPKRYSFATRGLASIDMNWPTALITDNGYLTAINNDGNRELTNEATFAFFEENPDIFDYIFIFTNFKSMYGNQRAEYISVSNHVSGIGITQRRGAHTFGSTGKLKGVVLMGDIKGYELTNSSELSSVLNLMVHEVAHSFGAYVNFFENEKHFYNLLESVDESFIHWSPNVSWVSPLGGLGWQENGDGSFTTELSRMSDPHLRQFSNLDLYLAGLLPAPFVGPIKYFVPDNPSAKGNTLFGAFQTIGIQEIMDGNGKRICMAGR